MSRRLCPSPCGSYKARIENGRIVVNCAMCGDAGKLTPAGARKLAAVLRGPLGRFETTAPRPERLRLASLLIARAVKLEARRKRGPVRARKVPSWTAPCGCFYQRLRGSSLNAPCSAHDYNSNAARLLAPADARYR